MRWLVLPLVVAALLTGPAAAVDKGVLLVVATRGPTTPVCAVEVPCDGPAAGVRVSVRRRGLVVARAVTAKDGRARLALLPGDYVVTASYGAVPGPRLQSESARVRAGRTTRVRFSFDTGIR